MRAVVGRDRMTWSEKLKKKMKTTPSCEGSSFSNRKND